jgi:hypothetical protein
MEDTMTEPDDAATTRPRQTLDTTIAAGDRVRPFDEVRDHRLVYDSDRRGTVLQVADEGQSVLVQWDERSAPSWNGGIGLVKVQPAPPAE